MWLLAVVGVALKACDCLTHSWLSTGVYLALGWLVLIAALPIVTNMPPPSVSRLVAGGLAYTANVAFFVLDSRIRYAHGLWLRARAATPSRCLTLPLDASAKVSI